MKKRKLGSGACAQKAICNIIVYIMMQNVSMKVTDKTYKCASAIFGQDKQWARIKSKIMLTNV